jgi:hypothetical protein
VSRLQWHLRTDDQEGGSVTSGAQGTQSRFSVRAAAALYDVKAQRVVWAETVDTTLTSNTYEDALARVFLFDEARTTDPHDKLFYDFPLPKGAASAAR